MKACSRTRAMAAMTLGVVLPTTALVACEPHENKLQAELRRKAEDEQKKTAIADKLSPAVKTKLDQVREIRALLEPVPRAPADAAPPAASPPMVLRPLHLDRPDGNTDVVLRWRSCAR